MSDAVDSRAVNNLIFDSENQERRSWVFFGKNIPRSQLVFFVQVLVVLIIVTVSVVNLSLAENCQDSTVWVAVLSSSVGYMLPAPTLK